jgi:hypothetical protein
MEMRLTTLAQTPDEGIPAWQVEVAAHSAQIATDRSSTALPLFRSWPA